MNSFSRSVLATQMPPLACKVLHPPESLWSFLAPLSPEQRESLWAALRPRGWGICEAAYLFSFDSFFFPLFFLSFNNSKLFSPLLVAESPGDCSFVLL